MEGAMERIPCAHCSRLFTPRNRKQYFCNKPGCQKARKAAWQRMKMNTDPAYKADEKFSQKKWVKNNPGYWTQYRKRNVDKAERNRALQPIRDRRRAERRASGAKMDAPFLAKMDARKGNEFNPVGRFWLVPVLAKMDARKVSIYAIASG